MNQMEYMLIARVFASTKPHSDAHGYKVWAETQRRMADAFEDADPHFQRDLFGYVSAGGTV